MGKTNFTLVGFFGLLFLAALIPSRLQAGQYSLANLCEVKNLSVHNGDLIVTNFTINQCTDKFGTGNQEGNGQYHCQSVTKIFSAEPNQLLSINFLQNYIIGFPADDIISGRLLILNGIMDVPMTSTSCSELGLASTPFSVDESTVLFDSEDDGSKFSKLSTTKVTSTAKGGGLTVVVLLYSTDIGSFPFTISMAPAPDVVCDLACIDQVNISLDQACSRTITPYDVDLTCTSFPGLDPDRYEIILQYPYPNLTLKYGPDQVGPELIGQNIIYRLRDSITGNSCWGHLRIEDKYPPVVNRVTRDTIACLDDSYLENIQTTLNACDSYYGYPGHVQFLSKTFEDFDCNDPLYPDFVGRIFREFRVTDLWGNGGTFLDTIYLWRLSATNLICPPDTSVDCSQIITESDGTDVDILWSDERFYTDATSGLRHPFPTEYSPTETGNYVHGFPAPGITYQIPGHPLDTVYLDGKSLGKCNLVVKYEDMVFKTCGTSYKIRRWWTIYDWCTGVEENCVQWIKITDETEPMVDFDHLAVAKYRDCTRDDQNGTLKDCTPGWFYSDAITPEEKPFIPVFAPAAGVAANYYQRYKESISTYSLYKDENDNDNLDEDEYFILHPIGKFNVRPHECSAHVTFPDFTEWLNDNSCHKDVNVFYSVEYDDPTHPGKVVIQHDEVTPNGFIYLPAGWHCILITFRDDCWNESSYWWRVAVYDETPPTPVCDAHTVVSLDPNKCWARISAKDLDDGSHDNCCEQLHFAVADMDTLNYWTEHWQNYFHDCLGAEAYYKHTADGSIKAIIDEWLNCFIFSDYIDVTGCGEQTLVMRVYEVCGAPHYDPHLFKGSEHQWYNYNLSDNYAGWFHWNYDKIKDQYADVPRVGLYCDYTCNNQFHYGWDVPYANWCLYTDDGDYDGVYRKTNLCVGVQEVSSEHGPYRNYASWTFESATCDPTPTDEDWKSYESRVDAASRYFLRVIADTLRYSWPVQWSDCMVDIEKQDKVAPVCSAPEDVTVFCDGVPYSGYVWVGRDSVYFEEANDAWKICDESDIHSSSCVLDNSSADHWHTGAGGSSSGDLTREWCYKAGPINDVYGHNQGYYSAPPNHIYPDCDGYKNSEGSWTPIYCRLWLLLDQYDTGLRIDPSDYLGQDEDVEVKECSGYDIEHEDEELLNECGVGTITRTWKVTENCEPGRSTYCYQKLTVKSRSDFEVCFPKDLVVDCSSSTGLTPAELDAELGEFAGTPSISDDDCELIGVHYEDQDFGIVTSDEGTCRKIIRVWTIVDWCVYNPDAKTHAPDVIVDDREKASEARACVYRCLKDDGDGYITYTQIIRIHDQVAPEVTCNELEVGQITGTDCNNLTIERDLGTATDACTPAEEIKYRWTISGTTHKGNGHVMQVELAPGTYTVILYASDRCGNEARCETNLVVKDTKAPTPYCYTGIATVLMPSTGSLEVWAKDLDAGSFDNCADDQLRFTFSEVAPEDDPDFDPNQGSSKRVFTCEDLGINPVQIWVWDESGNADFCEAELLIQQGAGGCTDISFALVLGEIKTELKDAVEFVDVELKENDATLNSMKTGVDGKYVISDLPKNHLYSMNVKRNDDHDNGISTLDIVQLQKHILGIEALNSPYKIIAGDVDNSRALSAVDIVTLRRLVLGIDETFKKNTSWRFVPADFVFANPAEPFDFPEPYKMPSMEQTEVKVDFIGVKIGDLNVTAKPNSNKLNDVEIRQYQPLVWQVEDQDLEVGKPTEVMFYAKDFKGIEGYQFTLKGTGLAIQQLTGIGINLQNDNFGWPQQSSQVLTASWSQGAALNLPDGTVAFGATLVSDKVGKLSEMLSMTSDVTAAESYRSGQTNPTVIEFVQPGSVNIRSGLSLYQNTPNPFADETAIGFVIPESGEASIKIMDLTGKLIKVIEGNYAKGYHEIKLKRKDIAIPQGVLYYSIDHGKETLTRKMILID